MDHELSVRSKTAEKYLLGELTVDERAAFEEHYFECADCAEDVRLGFQFAENTKAVFREDAKPAAAFVPRKKESAWLAWMRPSLLIPAAACLSIAAISSYQNLVQIPALRARAGDWSRPQALASIVLAPASRGATPSVAVKRGAPFFQLSLDIAEAGRFESYECDLRSPSGASLWKLPIRTPNPEAGLTLLIPTAGISSGPYEIVLIGRRGSDATEFNRYRFTVQWE